MSRFLCTIETSHMLAFDAVNDHTCWSHLTSPIINIASFLHTPIYNIKAKINLMHCPFCYQ